VMGMKCEYCDSMIRHVPDNGVCPNCGGVLPISVRQTIPSKQDSKPLYPKTPFAMQKGLFGYLELRERSLRLNVKKPYTPRIDATIPYDELFDAAYVPATMWLQGFLCIRGWQNRYNTIPKTVWECSSYDTIMYFDQLDNEVFHRAFVFLKEIARINASRRNK